MKRYHLLSLALVVILATLLIGCSSDVTITETVRITTTMQESGPTTTITSTTTMQESGPTTTITSTTTMQESGPTETITQTVTATVTLSITVTPTPEEKPPSVFTGAATDITTSSATLDGILINMGTASIVIVFFKIGETQGGPYTIQTYKETMNSSGAFGTSLFGLTAGRTYYYRAVAIGDGYSWGDEKSFRVRFS